jgi:hypothetical protein
MPESRQTVYSLQKLAIIALRAATSFVQTMQDKDIVLFDRLPIRTFAVLLLTYVLKLFARLRGHGAELNRCRGLGLSRILFQAVFHTTATRFRTVSADAQR